MDERQRPAQKTSARSKVYYTIQEVSEITEVKPYVLRFWETEFPHLKPKTGRGGRRQYQMDDIKLLVLIKRLLYQEGYTIEGARKRIREMEEKDFAQIEIPFDNLEKKSAIAGAVEDLRMLLALLDDG